ncbi:MAG: response regulator [Nitrospirota bacterium]
MDDSILIVDDEPYIFKSIKRILLDFPYKIYSASNGKEALDILEEQKIKLVISDEKMPEMSGTEFLSIVKERYPDIIRIMLTGHASIEAAMSAINTGEIYRFFTKPWVEIELIFAIRSAIEKYNLESENRKLLQTIKNHRIEIKFLERKHPGITRLQRDKEGNLIIPELSEAEIAKIVANSE